MSATVALVFALTGVMFVGIVVMFTGRVRLSVARRRGAAVRAPLIATGIGIVVGLAAAITLGTDAVLHLTHTFQTLTAAH